MKCHHRLIVLIVVILAGCAYNPDISTGSTDEEICLAIETAFLRVRCLAYVKEDPTVCNEVGCYALARKLKDGSICTTNAEDRTLYWGASESGPGRTVQKITSEFCQEFAVMEDEEFQKGYREIVSRWSEPLPDTGIAGQSVEEICGIGQKGCYGTCQVSKAGCIMAVALSRKDSSICREMEGMVAWIDECYRAIALDTGNVEVCNFAEGYVRDECYLDMVTEGIHLVYSSHSQERDKPLDQSS